jgi:selenide,water dikinase
LSDTLSGLPAPSDPNLLVGFDASDDAGVYRMSDTLALVHTADFITPPVDDPYWFGQIAAANALSDVYAMGGRPVTALNLVMFPSKQLDLGLLKDLMRGGHDKVAEAGAVVVGGHTVDDDEPKYGLAVSGTVHPQEILTNGGAQAGDALILTKPLGSGVIFNAIRSGKMKLEDVLGETLPTIAMLNDNALAAGREFTLHACTDVTGFGIAGHLLEMARGCGATIAVEFDRLPLYDGALTMYRKGETTGSNRANRDLSADHFELQRSLSKPKKELLFDPQTSGGLVLAVPESEADALVAALRRASVVDATRIATVLEGDVAIQVV